MQELVAQPSLAAAVPAVPDWLSVVKSLRAGGRHREALSILLPMIQRPDPGLNEIDYAATCYFDLGDAETARALAQVMVQRWPGTAAVWAKLAAIEQALGKRDAAIAGFQEALKRDPFLIRALSTLNGLKPFSRVGQHASRLNKLSRRGDLSPMDRALVLNTLGQIERRAGNVTAAMRFFRRSNAALNARFDADRSAQLLREQLDAFQPLPQDRLQPDGPRVIFICGVPRSGTTLAERILERHSAVDSIGESRALTDTLEDVRKHVAKRGRGRSLWSWYGQLSDEEISIFRRRYFELALPVGQKGPVIIDKMPMNCRDLALAHMLLPDARFVFMSRHPLDVGLSNFSICYQEVVSFSCRLDWIGSVISDVFASALDYQAKLGGQMRAQSYRALVTEPETQIRALVDHCGLDWEDDCLAPEDGGGAVNTASVLQVREKINSDGLDKWRAFEGELQPLTEALGGEEWLNQWQAWDDHAAKTGRFV